MTRYIDFDVELSRYDDQRFTVVVRRLHPDDNTSKRTEITTPVSFDLARLNEAKDDAAEYGRALTEQLFAGSELREELARALEAARGHDDLAVRFRLSVSQTAPVLHTLRWETLRDPSDATAALLTNENVVFSRHVYTSRGRGLPSTAPGELKALVVIASPADLQLVRKTGYAPLSPIDHAEELQAARARLRGYAVTALAEPGKATIDAIFDRLREEEYHVLYLVCHGAPGERPRLVLEDENGNRDVVDAADVVRRMRDIQHPPLMVVLAVCRSGGAEYTSSGESVSRLGPELAVKAGIPVVLAMQGDVTYESVSPFLETFFENIRDDGDVDHAVTVARGAIRDRSDAWMPVLYMRLLDGKLWSGQPRISARRAFDRWDSLLNNISRGRCTPVIGFGVYEEMFGDAATLARRWGETYRYPLNEDDELPEIAQYLAINQDTQFPRDELVAHFRREVLRRYGDRIPEQDRDKGTDELITAAWRAVAQPGDPHRILARLPCSLYLTANLSTLLEAALEEAGVQPRSAICQWNTRFRQKSLPKDLDFRNPLVYHLFGRLGFDEDESIVLTEDDYFDYLVATADGRQPDPIVRGRANNSSLMLLGFRITDWNLRVLFRTLMSERTDDEQRFTSVAVQVDPHQPGSADPERIYAYLERYFGGRRIDIFPGSVSDFTTELAARWGQKFPGDDLTQKRVAVRPR